MKTAVLSILASLSFAPGAFAGSCPSPTAKAVLQDARQLLLVTSPGWNSPRAQLRLYERATSGEPWRARGPAHPAVIGRAGLAWGWSDPDLGKPGEPLKREGDGRTPAGVHRLGTAFGFQASSIKPYLLLKPSTVCVDDPQSRYYNTIVDSKDVVKDWSSAEKMREIDAYKIGFEVNYQSSREQRAGSCIFVHIWSGPESGTAGCVAASESAVAELQKTLQPSARPAIAFLPESEWRAWQECWKGAAPPGAGPTPAVY